MLIICGWLAHFPPVDSTSLYMGRWAVRSVGGHCNLHRLSRLASELEDKEAKSDFNCLVGAAGDWLMELVRCDRSWFSRTAARVVSRLPMRTKMLQAMGLKCLAAAALPLRSSSIGGSRWVVAVAVVVTGRVGWGRWSR